MSVVLYRNTLISKLKLIILLLLFNIKPGFSQQESKVWFVWSDNAFKTHNHQSIYILSTNAGSDTIFPTNQDFLNADTITFILNNYKNPVYIEFSIDTLKKTSRKLNLIPFRTYHIIENDDKLVVTSKPLNFDYLDPKAQLLYSFIIKLVLELIVALLVAALLRLPARLLFFVFVANIMSFPLVYISFFPFYMKELTTILLEGLFIFLIGWKRLKITKAMLVSLIVNVARFGLYKAVMLIIKIV